MVTGASLAGRTSRAAPGALRLQRWAQPEGWLPVARLDEIQGLTEVYPGGHPVLLAPVNGQVYAVDGRCPHRGGPLAGGRLNGCAIVCPWHSFAYDVRTGQPVWPEGWDPVPTYATRIRDGMVELLVGAPE